MRGVFSSILCRSALLIVGFLCIPVVIARQQSVAPQTQANARSAADSYSQESAVTEDAAVKIRLEKDGPRNHRTVRARKDSGGIGRSQRGDSAFPLPRW
jgi:hypothetical protein